MNEPLMSINEVADFLNLNRRTVESIIKRGELSAFKIGQQYRLVRGDVEEWLHQKRIGA